jgi:hypothetical protein
MASMASSPQTREQRRQRAAIGVFVLSLHALLWLALLNTIVRQRSVPESPRVSVRLLPARVEQPELPRAGPASPPITTADRAPSRQRQTRRLVETNEPALPTAAAPITTAEAASAAAQTSPDTDLLHTDASRRAIRSAAHQPNLASRVNEQVGVRSPTRDEQLSAATQQAGRPDCLKADALKNDPPEIGGIGLGGLLALPFLPHAALTGKCALP